MTFLSQAEALQGFPPPARQHGTEPPSYSQSATDVWGVWVPSPNGHGGDHWDVYRKDGKGYVNVYPNGQRRKGKGKEPRIPPSSPQPNATPMPSPTPSPRQEIYLPTPKPEVIIDRLPNPERLQPPDDLPESPDLRIPS